MDFNHDIEKARQALTRSGADGLLVETQANFHWLTGGRGFIGLNSETACAALLITRDRQYLVANNIEAKRLMAEELCGTFDLLEYPWHDESGKRKAIKTACSGAIVHDCEIVADLQNARTILPEWRIDRLRRSGQIIARILEQELLAAKKGMTELELAGRLSSLLWREKVEPVTILIGFDERTESYRHLLPTENRLHHRAVASLAVRHRGLFISVTRHICFGTVPAVIAAKHQAVSLVHAAAINATRAGATMDDMCPAIAA
ncbi:MAG: aminopeptidase P family protein, partial [Planctomycetes bacterium]|nr:aminopeptidase P family protein [Planctomycetota bacterium]